MSYSRQELVSDGTLNSVALGIQYIERTDIHLYIDDVEMDQVGGSTPYLWDWIDDSTLSITPVVPNASTVRIVRQTQLSSMYHDYDAGAVFSEVTVDENFVQNLHLAQEYLEGQAASDIYKNLNMHGNRITNLGAALDPDDAVSLKELQSAIGGTASLNIYQFTGTGAQTDFVLGASPKFKSATQVYINGVYQNKSEYALTGVNSDTITFSSAPSSGASIEVVALQVNVMGSTDSSLVTHTAVGTGAIQRTVKEKLQDFVSVLDFGASPSATGETNRTAFNAAFTYLGTLGGGTLHIPKGTYELSDYVGNTGISAEPISFAVVGDPGTVLNFNPNTHSNYGLYLQWTNLQNLVVQDLTVQCNDKVAVGVHIATASATPAVSVTVERVQVYNCNAVNHIDITRSPKGISVASDGWGYTATVRDCIVRSVKRLKSGLACTGISCTGFQNTWVCNNTVHTVTYNGQDAQDADGILVFSDMVGGDYKQSTCVIQGNTIIDCDGRMIKLQTKGSAVVRDNHMQLLSAMTLIANWRCIDSQVADATIVDNKIFIGDLWTGGSSATLCLLNNPLVANVDSPYQQFVQRFSNNACHVMKDVAYGIVPVPPVQGVIANCYLEVCDNKINSNASAVSTTQTDPTVSTFIYIGSGWPTPANFTAEWTWNIARNNVYSYDFIELLGAQADYTDKWFPYVLDNIKPSFGYTRQVFKSGATTGPYSSSCLIRDNNIGSQTVVNSGGTVGWPVDLKKILVGSDFCTESQALINAPLVSNNSRVYRKGGQLGIERASHGTYFSADGTTWTLSRPLGFAGSATYNPASLTTGTGVTTTVTVTGAALGNAVMVSFSLDLQGVLLTAWVSAANTVSVRFWNETGGTIDLASGTIRVVTQAITAI